MLPIINHFLCLNKFGVNFGNSMIFGGHTKNIHKGPDKDVGKDAQLGLSLVFLIKFLVQFKNENYQTKVC